MMGAPGWAGGNTAVFWDQELLSWGTGREWSLLQPYSRKVISLQSLSNALSNAHPGGLFVTAQGGRSTLGATRGRL